MLLDFFAGWCALSTTRPKSNGDNRRQFRSNRDGSVLAYTSRENRSSACSTESCQTLALTRRARRLDRHPRELDSSLINSMLFLNKFYMV